jgi:hypothetical protein
VVEDPITLEKDRVGTWEVSRLAERYRSLRSAAGRRGAVAADERTREVTSRHSSYEPGEQGGEVRGGVGGAKRGNQGECGPAKTQGRVRVTQALDRIRQVAKQPHVRFAVNHPR